MELSEDFFEAFKEIHKYGLATIRAFLFKKGKITQLSFKNIKGISEKFKNIRSIPEIRNIPEKKLAWM